MNLVIIEDNLPLLENLRLLLDGEQTISVVGAFSTGAAALKNIAACRPDLILSDLGLPDMDGQDLIRSIKAAMPEVDVMVLTVFDDRENVFAALKAGASGYLLKGTTPREIIEAVQNLRNGGAPMSPKIAKMVLQEFQTGIAEEQDILSAREVQVLRSLEKGGTYKDIAAQLGISPQTVRTHIKNIYEKLHVKSRSEAVQASKRKGIL
jgi:two-component system, NarL family, response regulator